MIDQPDLLAPVPAPAEADPPPETLFDALRHETEDGIEYWSARELARVLGYTDYRNFQKVVDKARLACANSGHPPADHFVDANEMITIGKGGQRRVADVRLSRYAGFLVVQNADPEKPVVALGQTYFAVQTRRMELADALTADALGGMSEDQRRLFIRHQLAEQNTQLAAAARRAGVRSPDDFAIFQDHGYMGLYAGERTRDIARRKGLAASQRILDYMGSDELAANLFRSSLARQRLQRDNVQDQEAANATHYEVGQAVRQVIADQGGAMPEQLPTPADGIAQLEGRERRRTQQAEARQAQLAAGQQVLFEGE
jgi:DNA-damage-inducible protein D